MRKTLTQVKFLLPPLRRLSVDCGIPRYEAMYPRLALPEKAIHITNRDSPCIYRLHRLSIFLAGLPEIDLVHAEYHISFYGEGCINLPAILHEPVMAKAAFFDEPDITAEYACLQNEFFLGEMAWLQIRSQYL